jgi:hypothetical protein
MMRVILFGGFILLPLSMVWSQKVYRTGFLQQVNVNLPVSATWRLNTKVESRQSLVEQEGAKGWKAKYRYDLMDVAFVLSKRLDPNNTLGAGYMTRFRNGAISHRFIQQYSRVTTYDLFRLAHRVSTDQTFSGGGPLQVRLRYRIGVEKAWNGKTVDPKEFYVKANAEFLGAWERDETSLEVRIVPTLGYAFSDANKFEAGIDYREDGVFSGGARNRLWIYIAWFITV